MNEIKSLKKRVHVCESQLYDLKLQIGFKASGASYPTEGTEGSE